MTSLSQRVTCIEIVAYHSRKSGPITDDLIASLPSSRLAIDFVRERSAEGAQVIRGDRFSEGALASAFESGLLLRILRRVAELAALSGQQPMELPDPWFALTVHDGASLELPGLYEWRIDGVGSYIGRYTRSTRPTRQYTQNVRNLLAGRGYRPGKENGFRRIHVALADAVRAERGIKLHILENPAAWEIAARERELIAERGTLNGTGRPGEAAD